LDEKKKEEKREKREKKKLVYISVGKWIENTSRKFGRE